MKAESFGACFGACADKVAGSGYRSCGAPQAIMARGRGLSTQLQSRIFALAGAKRCPEKSPYRLSSLLKVCAPTRAEKGCINYDLHVSPDNPGLLVFHENWVSKEDLDAHLASPHIDAFRAVAPDLSEPANITLWSEIED